MAASKMRTKNAANDRSGSENNAKGRDGMNRCKIAGKSSNRVHEDKQRRNGGRLSNMRPLAEQQKRCEEYSAAGPSQPGKKSEAGSNANGGRLRGGEKFCRIVAPEDQARRGENEHQADQNSQDGSGW